MKRIDFDKLELFDQIKYVNTELLKGNTLTNLCKSIDISRSTIRNRFEKLKYSYNKATNQYEPIVKISETKLLESIPKHPIEYISTFTQQNNNKVVSIDNDLLNNIVNNYEENLSKLNEVYDWYKMQNSNKSVDTKKLNIDDFEGDIVVRSYKLYGSIQKKFTDFCRKNNKYKVQDILSQALNDFLEKYK